MEGTDTSNGAPAQGAGDRAEEFRKMLDTPLAPDEAQRMLADIDVQMAQMSVMRLSLQAQLTQLELQMAQASFDRSVVIRRTLNPQEQADD